MITLFLAVSLPQASANLLDDFNRSDSSLLGNGWIEKNPASQALLNLSAQKQSVTTGYRDNIVYRPGTENLLDVEASVELRLNTIPPGYPQIFVRVQSDTVAQPDFVSGYILYINDSDSQAILGRQTGSNFVTTLASIPLSAILNTTDTFRLRLSATGANPVSLSANIERFTGSAWETIGQANIDDTSASQITTAGSVGFGGYVENSYRYDNFRRVNLGSGAVNPLPAITVLTPSSQTEGGADFLLTVSGSDFVDGSVVRWNGADRVTTFVSAVELQATITGADIAVTGNAEVTVYTPGPGGGVSNSLNFTIDPITQNPVPALTEVTPSSVTAGSSDFLLTVTGSGIIPESIVRWNGSNRTTTYISDTQLQATIPASDIASAGTAEVTIFNPTPGGGISGALNVSITDSQISNPVPVLGSTSPTSISQGSPGFTLAVTGADFVPGAIVQWNGSDRTTAYISATELQAAIPDTDLQTSGDATITVTNPTPGGGISNSQLFTVNAVVPNPVPDIVTLSPASVQAGSTNLTLTVTGVNFIDSTVVRWNGVDMPTAFVSATQIQAAIPDSELQSTGSATVTTFNPAPGGGESGIAVFTITDPSPPGGGSVATALQPEFVYSGESGVNLTITGVNFATDSIIRWNGADRQTTFISDTELQASISVADVQNPGIASVTVFSSATGTTEPLTFIVLDPLANYFSDTFNRPDSETIGNNWTEKLDQAYSIQNGQIVGVDTQNINGESYVFHDTIVYRPEVEDIQDVEVSIEFVRQQTDGWEFPQLHARVQRDSVAINGTLESYIMYVDDTRDSPTMTFAIVQPNYNELECNIGEYAMPAPLMAGERYRLRFQVSGSYPVSLTGYLDRFNGQSWEIFTQATMVHDDNTQPSTYYCYPGYVPPPITTAGTIGFAKWSTDTQVYDNFYWIDLNATSGSSGNPLPVVTGVAPTSVTAGDPSFTLTVTGSDFSTNSIIRWNGSDRTTNFVSSTELQANIPSSDITTAGSVAVTVFTPSPGGGESASVVFAINDAAGTDNPVPATSQTTPASGVTGSSDFIMTVSGTGFVQESVVRWNGADLSTQFVSATQLDATVPAANMTAAGTAVVEVFTPAPGGGLSNPQSFSIIDPGSTFFDDFERADSGSLGNGWQEKDPAAFFVINGQAQKQVNSSGYRDNIVYRPATEDTLNTEVTLEFRLLDAQPGYPQILVRVQSDTAAIPDTLDAYMLYINDNPGQAIIGRQTGTSFVTTLANINISPNLNTADTYRLRLSATGTNPVTIDAYIERLNGSVWETIGQASVSDTSAERIENPGSAGFGGYIEGSYLFDNFRRIDLSL